MAPFSAQWYQKSSRASGMERYLQNRHSTSQMQPVYYAFEPVGPLFGSVAPNFRLVGVQVR